MVPSVTSRWGPRWCQEPVHPACPPPPPQPPPLPSSPSQSFQVPGRKSHRTLCLSADSWKVTLSDECSWVGLEGSFFLLFFFFSFFFVSHELHHWAAPWLYWSDSCGFRPFPTLLPRSLSGPLLAQAGRSGWAEVRVLAPCPFRPPGPELERTAVLGTDT